MVMGWDARSSQHMFTLATARLFQRLAKLIIKWALSNPWVMLPGGGYAPMDMWIVMPDGTVLSFNGSSIIECFHKNSNRVRASVGGENTTPRLRAAVIEHTNMDWNYNR